MAGNCCNTVNTGGVKPKVNRNFMAQISGKVDGVQTKKTQDAIEKYFPGSMKGRIVEAKVYEALSKLGFNDDNTLYGDCTCPDEINHNDPGADITSLFMHRWGEIFPLSGLAGLPFCGRTGWGAFSSHVPQDGNILVLYAPHVGVDYHGNVGKIHREGIDNFTTACGAAVGAYNAVLKDKKEAQFQSGYIDHQMDAIKHLVAERAHKIKGTKNEMATLAYQMFEIVDKFLNEIINMNWASSNGKLALVGGIMINCDGERTDMFLPLKFDLVHKSGRRDELFKSTFGKDPYRCSS